MLEELNNQLETYLNNDPELNRRLAGFRAFSGLPDLHYVRARQAGDSCPARAVKCYPFGGESQLGDQELIGIEVIDSGEKIVVTRKEGRFIIHSKDWEHPYLTIRLPKDLFRKTVLGRHRWVWVMAMDDVEISSAEGLPHSDWVTLLEILVVMQEIAEFEPTIWKLIENLK